MDRLFLSKDSFLYDFPPAVALLGKNHDRAVAKLTPYLEDGTLSQRDFDSTLNLVDTVMDERLSVSKRTFSKKKCTLFTQIAAHE